MQIFCADFIVIGGKRQFITVARNIVDRSIFLQNRRYAAGQDLVDWLLWAELQAPLV